MEKNNSYTLGQLRAKALDYADIDLKNKDLDGCNQDIKLFLEKINEQSPVAKEITKEFDKIEQRKQQQYKQLQLMLQDKGILEQIEGKNNGQFEIEANTLFDKKIVCWTLALKYKLFEDDTEVEYEI